jgi:cytochrome P450
VGRDTYKEMALLPQINQQWNNLYINTTPFHHAFLVSLFLLSLSLLFIRRKWSGVKLNLPPSLPKLPVIGNLHHLGSLPHRSLREVAQKYGHDLMLLHLGQAPTLVVSSAEMLREIVKSHDILISNRPKTTAANILLYGCKDLGFAPYGEYWRQVKKTSVHELLSVKRVLQFQCVRDQEVSVMVNRIRKACVNGASINLSDMFITISNNIVSRCVLGRSFEEEDGTSRFGELGRRMANQFMEFSVGDFFPYLRWIDVVTGFIGRLKASFEELDAFLDEVLEEHKARLESDGGNSHTNDFVDILLRLQKDDMLDFNLTKNNLKAILTNMFLGGSDTTSTGLEWLMAELIRHPNVMKKVQEEVRRVVGKKTNIEMDDINKMEYLNCVIKENLRLHPPAPLLAPRETTKDFEIGGYHIPAKTRVFINAWGIQRDPRLWDRPEEFIPERFQNNSIDFKGQDPQLVPFGIGRRGCPGISFGVASTEFVIANVLYWFDWKLPEDVVLGKKNMDMSEVNGIVVHKKFSLHLVPIPYSNAA